jgi:hypothetical protein
LQEQSNLYQRALKQKEEGEEKFNAAKEQMARLQSLVDKKVNEAMKEELAKHRKVEAENYALHDQNKALKDERDHLQKEVDRLRETVAGIDSHEDHDKLGSQKNA